MKNVITAITLCTLILLVSGQAKSEITGSSHIWETDVSVDAFTDKEIVLSVISAEGGMSSGFIAFGCLASGFEGKLSAGKYVGSMELNNNLKYRVDKNEPVDITMIPGGKFLVFDDIKSPLVQDLLRGKEKVVIRILSGAGISNASFSLNGSTKAIQAVINSCKNR